MPFAPGTVIANEFRVVRPMAEGGMGAVYEAEQLSTGRKRALKTMHAGLASDPNALARFAQEARVGSVIDSDHVVEVVAAGIDDATGVPWLVMELLDGETLGDRIERGPLSPPEALPVMDQMCHALAAAHRRGIVHRDLKPDNVFLARARRGDVPFTVKILDFGIAKWMQEIQGASANSQAMGTPLWMAPEQATPGASIRPSTDVWAVGLIAFAMLTGRSYWRAASTPGASVQSLVVEIMVEPLEPVSSRCHALGCPASPPPMFDAWFARCVVREPERRYADAAEAMHALRAVFGPEATELAGPQPMPATVPPLAPSMPQAAATAPAPSSSRGLIVGLVVGAVALSGLALLGGGALFWLGRRSASEGSVASRPPPSPPAPTSRNVKHIDAGPLHACAVLDDASVRCWGNNMYGQLGDGSKQGHATPTKVDGLEGVASISAGSSYTCAVLETGVVKCWGDNQRGQLGDGTQIARLLPTMALDLTGVESVAAGFWHTCATLRDRSLRCWGSNDFGGLAGAPSAPRPNVVSAVRDVKRIAINVQQSCALLFNGHVACWGALQRTPKDVPGLTSVVTIDVGAASACAVSGQGAVHCWGKNDAGQLGDGSTKSSSRPVRVVGIEDAKDVSVGAAHACALHADGHVSCWGSNEVGELGDGSGREQPTPVRVPDLVAVELALGGNASYAVTTDGQIHAWGGNDNGQLGDGTMTAKSKPTHIAVR